MTSDFIIVGAGTAGCVLASRLAAAGFHVLLLEAGPADRNPWIAVPFGMQMLIANPAVNWLYQSEPVANLNGRRLFQPRGKVVGGTGSINASLYVRGNRADFDGWSAAGCAGWSYDEVLPYFRKFEDHETMQGPYHGSGGPIGITSPPGDRLSRIFLDAVDGLGLPRTDDFNGATQEGFGRFQTMTRANRRSSSAIEYLRPALRMGRVRLVPQAHVTRLLLDGTRVTGVEYRHRSRLLRATAGREVLLCGGVFNSPQLLEFSGIGQADRLKSLGLQVRHDLPGVGENLQDHFGIKLVYRTGRADLSLNGLARSWPRKALLALRYAMTRGGALGWTNTFAGGFMRSDGQEPAPDLQFTLNAWSASATSRHGMKAHDFPGFTVNAYQLQPDGRGNVHIATAQADAAPRITLVALDSERDRRAMRSAIRMARSIVATPPFRAIDAREVLPGPALEDDDALDAALREQLISMFHPVGTCRMGVDGQAVVDPNLRVHGLAGLRVVDASIMPTLPRGNTNAATLMLAEKAADLIVETARNDGASRNTFSPAAPLGANHAGQ
ncbi:MAG: GMC family oxidoreductase [Mesorhizobium sp.]